MSWQSGATTTASRLWGLRWDINPAQMALARLVTPIRSAGRPGSYLRLGPGNIITVPVGPINGILAVINTYVNFDLLVGQDASGQWAGFIRIAFGIGNESSSTGILDTVEDYFSSVIPAVNLIPTPVAWADQTVPAQAFGIYASSASWAGFSAAFSEAPTAGSPTVGALAEGFGIFRLPTVEID